MTDDELRRLAEAATERPWRLAQDDDSDRGTYDLPSIMACDDSIDIACCDYDPLTENQKLANAAYIVAACNAVPALLDRLAVYERRVQGLRHALQFMPLWSQHHLMIKGAERALAADDALAGGTSDTTPPIAAQAKAIQPGDVVYRPDGEPRVPKAGDFLLAATWSMLHVSPDDEEWESTQQVYNLLDAV